MGVINNLFYGKPPQFINKRRTRYKNRQGAIRVGK